MTTSIVTEGCWHCGGDLSFDGDGLYCMQCGRQDIKEVISLEEERDKLLIAGRGRHHGVRVKK